MTTVARTTRVGGLLVLALALFVAIVFTLGQQQHFWERKVQYEIHFARTNGLQEGGQVSLSGVAVGTVTDLSFPPDPHVNYIIIQIAVAAKAAPKIRADSIASIRTFGLLGDRYIEISPGSADVPEVPDGGLLTALDPTDLEAVFGQSGDIVTNVVEVTTQLKDVLGAINRGEGLLGAMVRNKEFGEQTLQKLDDTLSNVQHTSRALATVMLRVERGEGLAGHLLRDSKQTRDMMANLEHAAASLDRLSTELRTGQGVLPRLASDTAYAKRVLGKLDDTVTNLQEITAKVNRGEGTAGKLVNDTALYTQSQDLIRSFGRSWLLQVYRGITGFWPFGGEEEAR
jgi:phospholipid/cholesterol/gamma-HCH transport system substrate-binding protein